VKGIEDGTLDREKFRFYIIQDYLYLEDYAKTLDCQPFLRHFFVGH
jgi:thiaminase